MKCESFYRGDPVLVEVSTPGGATMVEGECIEDGAVEYSEKSRWWSIQKFPRVRISEASQHWPGVIACPSRAAEIEHRIGVADA